MIDVVAGIIENEGKILIARRKPGSHLAGYWEFPGGKIEAGETPQSSLTRELKEELSITTEPTEYITESIYDYGNKRIRLIAYKAKFLFGTITLDSHDDFRWVSIDEIKSFQLAPADIPIMNTLIQNHKQPK